MGITYFILFFCIIIPLLMEEKNENISSFIQLKKRGDRIFMEKYLQELVGECCMIKTLKGDYVGKLIEVDQSSLILENKENKEFINLEYVISAKRVPVNKKGKQKLFYM